MTLLVKFCGLSTPETVETAIRLGASHIGLVHFPPSPRHIELKAAAELRQRAGGRIKVALLLVDAGPELTARAFGIVRPDILQFHGDETPEWLGLLKQHIDAEIWKAVGLRDAASLVHAAKFHGVADRLLFDSPAHALPGGTGTRFDWSLLAGHEHRTPWAVAGGLTPDNVAAAILATGAPMVDVSSGVESAPGVKDVDKMAAFLQAARR